MMGFLIKHFRGVSAAVLIILTASLVGCQDRYRYACQDPDNWETTECQKPACEVNRTCPDLIFEKNDKIKFDTVPEASASKTPVKGECK